jgi:ABC-type branched-subunit amino acid transport system permease subunit
MPLVPSHLIYPFFFREMPSISFSGGVIIAALTGVLLGLPVMRLRGDYLAIVTLGFGEVIRVLANNLDKPINLTNGPQGITPIQRPTMPELVVEFFNWFCEEWWGMMSVVPICIMSCSIFSPCW